MKKFLLISTLLVSLWGIEAQAANQCLPTPSCEELGYTKTSCVDNSGIKCPFGDTYFCICPSKYQHPCKSVGNEGIGLSCDGKYVECGCAEGYILKDERCEPQCETGTEIGYILYSDMTRSAELDESKTPIGVVVCSYADGGGQALALTNLNQKYKWSEENIDILSLKNFSSSTASQDYASCDNSKKIMAMGDASLYPAVWAAHNYTTEGTKVGDWCLPAAGILSLYLKNKTLIDEALVRAGGKEEKYITSSTERANGYIISLYSIYLYDYLKKNSTENVRPVIAF